MTTHVIILAQGTQRRMGPGAGLKQLLPLPACGNTPIIARTIRMVQAMIPRSHPIVVGWSSLIGEVAAQFAGSFSSYQLRDPGNSSLRGLARYLSETRTVPWLPMSLSQTPPVRTIVLLGDVVYSWACWQAIHALAMNGHGFVGTRNLSADTGELWGVGWSASYEDHMLGELGDALKRHPPFEDEYQPGQLRRWVMGWNRGDLRARVDKLITAGTYTPIDDYTMDVDLPAHIPLLTPASQAACEDDRTKGITW